MSSWFGERAEGRYAEAAAAIAEREHGVVDRCGLRLRARRYHAVRYRVVSDTRPTRHARQGRPVKTDPPPTKASYHLVVFGDIACRIAAGTRGARHSKDSRGGS